jgi:serine-type D-Ala-D-Ala carboxypeptidase
VPKVASAALAALLGASASFGVTARDAYVRASASAGAFVDALGLGHHAADYSDGLPLATPTTVGMSAERLAAVDRAVLRGIEVGGFPGASVVVGRRGYAVIKRGYGSLSWAGDSPAVDEKTIYDLASLTKVIATTTAVMVLYDEGKIDLDAPVRSYVPAFSGGGKERVTVRHLLTHRSGLPAGRDLWRSASSPAEARRQVLETPIYCRPGDCFEYSDLGADVLGFVVETVAGERMDKFLEQRVYGPLGMTDTYFRPPTSVKWRVAPTEVSPPRGYPLKGEVHDENAYALGGVAGHAGLFSTAADLSIYAQMMINGGEYGGVRVIADSTVKLFTRREAGTRALGWDTCNNRGSCGSLMGEEAYGHTGFTGTSLWVDPERDLFVILLTNRVHAAKAQRPAKVIADVRADLSDAAELAVVDLPDGPRAMPASFRVDEKNGWTKPRVTRGKSRSKHSSAKSAKSSKSKSKSGASAKSGKSKSSAKSASKSASKSKASAKKKVAAKKTTGRR